MATLQHDAKYDLLKYILSIMVVAIHSTLYPETLFPWLRIAVPLFFIMSSYFLFSQLDYPDTAKQKKILGKYILRNIKLYAFWFTILLPITLYLRRDIYLSGNILLRFIKFLRNLFLGSTFVASWYITASIIGIYIIFYMSKKFPNFIICIIASVTFMIITFWSSYQFLFKDSNLVQQIIHWYTIILGNPTLSFPASIFWIYIGKCFAEGRIKSLPNKLAACILICSIIGLYLEWQLVWKTTGICNNDSYFMLAPVCVTLFMLIQKMKPITFQHAVTLRKISTVTYVSHGSIIAIVRYAIKHLFSIEANLIFFLVTLFTCFLLYLMIHFLLQRSKCKQIVSLLKNAM